MFGLLFYTLFAASSVVAWDFIVSEKSYSGETPTTDAKRVCKLYREIKDIKSATQKQTEWFLWNFIKLHSQTCFETTKTLGKFKYQELMKKYYTPRKLLGTDILVLPYYSNGTWFNGLITHKNSTSTVIRVVCEGNDVTNEIKTYMGPQGDFYGQSSITPANLGYKHLTFTFFNNGSLQTIELRSDDEVIHLQTHSGALSDPPKIPPFSSCRHECHDDALINRTIGEHISSSQSFIELQ